MVTVLLGHHINAYGAMKSLRLASYLILNTGKCV
jgi:hypothetical protein